MNEENTTAASEAPAENKALDSGGVTLDERQWLDNAIAAAGGEVTGGGVGCGGVDLNYTVNGISFNARITRVETTAQKAAA